MNGRRGGRGALAGVVALGVVVGLVLGTAAPAAAHSVSGVSSTNYLTTLEGITPETPGIEARVVEKGSRIELTNTNEADVVVLGYEDEPYLRIGPDGVFENQRSPATYLNQDRTGSQSGGENADPEAPPEWERLSSGQTARWHDHRIHWMGANVDRPDRRVVVEDEWVIPLRYEGDRIEVTGQLLWVPGPSSLPWYLLIAGLVALGAFVGGRRWWGRGLAALLGALIVIDLVHVIGILGARAGGPDLASLGSNLLYSLVAWVVGGVAVSMLLREKRDGLFAAIFAAVLIAVFGGLQDLGVLRHSQVPFAWAEDLARLFVAASVGLGAGVTVGAVISLVRLGAFTVAKGPPLATAGGPAVTGGQGAAEARPDDAASGDEAPDPVEDRPEPTG